MHVLTEVNYRRQTDGHGLIIRLSLPERRKHVARSPATHPCSCGPVAGARIGTWLPGSDGQVSDLAARAPPLLVGQGGFTYITNVRSACLADEGQLRRAAGHKKYFNAVKVLDDTHGAVPRQAPHDTRRPGFPYRLDQVSTAPAL